MATDGTGEGWVQWKSETNQDNGDQSWKQSNRWSEKEPHDWKQNSSWYSNDGKWSDSNQNSTWDRAWSKQSQAADWRNVPVPQDDEEKKEQKIECVVVQNTHTYSQARPSEQDSLMKVPSSSSSQSPTPAVSSRVTRLKRARNEEPEDCIDDKRQKIELVDSQDGEVLKDGNAEVRNDWLTVEQKDISGIGEDPIVLAAWIVVEEPSEWTYNRPSMRPATLFSDALEEQYQNNIGCLMHKLCFDKGHGHSAEIYYEHDLRKKPWVQRRYSGMDKARLIHEKQIHRILIQGSKE
jgi:hypothetical protein